MFDILDSCAVLPDAHAAVVRHPVSPARSTPPTGPGIDPQEESGPELAAAAAEEEDSHRAVGVEYMQNGKLLKAYLSGHAPSSSSRKSSSWVVEPSPKIRYVIFRSRCKSSRRSRRRSSYRSRCRSSCRSRCRFTCRSRCKSSYQSR